jgi:hypothetical protein
VRKAVTTLFGVAIAIALAGETTFAQQSRPERPYRGLFGGDRDSGDAERSLIATASVGAGFDTDVLTDASNVGVGPGGNNPIQSTEGGYIALSEGLSYSLNKQVISFGVNGSASARYYPTLENNVITNYGAGLGTSWRPTTRNRISGNASFTYQPFSLNALFPVFGETPLGEIYLADLDYGTVDAGYYTSTASVDVSRNLSSRATVSGGYSYQRSDFALYPDYTSDTVSAHFTRSLNAGLGVRIGYNYTHARYSDGMPVAARHGLDTGVDYSKTLSFSRRTSLSFSTGGTATSYEGDTHFTAVGSANLSHEIGRTWTFNAGYSRNVGFLETFAAAPFVYDAATVTLGGLLDRRWSFDAAAGAALGNLGFGSSSSGFNTYYATTGVSRALNRFFKVGIQYSFYRYDFAQTTLLPAGYNSDFSRNTVSATLSAWLPLFQRGRRGNAAR